MVSRATSLKVYMKFYALLQVFIKLGILDFLHMCMCAAKFYSLFF
jgi:hypothetical protein